MNGELNININEKALKDNNNINTLIEAANTIFYSHEKDFEAIKNKNIFIRLWEFITLSQDNKIIVEKEITSLSQMQYIIIKVLSLLSNKQMQIANLINLNRDTINVILESLNIQKDELLSIKKALSSAVYYPSIKISEIPFHDIRLMYCAIYNYTLLYPENKLIQSYNRVIEKWFDLVNQYPDDFNYTDLKQLEATKSGELLFTIIYELTCIFNESNEFDERYENAIKYIPISNPKKDEILQKTKKIIHVLGIESLEQQYYNESLEAYNEELTLMESSLSEIEPKNEERNNLLNDNEQNNINEKYSVFNGNYKQKKTVSGTEALTIIIPSAIGVLLGIGVSSAIKNKINEGKESFSSTGGLSF
jgi:hypothetical protein